MVILQDLGDPTGSQFMTSVLVLGNFIRKKVSKRDVNVTSRSFGCINCRLCCGLHITEYAALAISTLNSNNSLTVLATALHFAY